MPKNKKSKSHQLSGTAVLSGVLSNSSASGLFVVTRYEINSSLCDSWNQLSDTFARWKVNKLDFKFVPIQGMTTPGTAGMAILEDTDSASPSTTPQAMNCRCATLGTVREPLWLKYRPKHSNWLWTRDAVAYTQDRLEMPGDFIFWSENTSSAFVPGIVELKYSVEFDSIINTALSSPNREVPSQKEENNSKVPTIDVNRLEEIVSRYGFTLSKKS